MAAVTIVAAAGVTLTGCRPPACSQPYPAAQWVERYYSSDPWPAGSTQRPGPSSLFDSDADGLEDTVVGATAAAVPRVIVHRAGGDVIFEAEHSVAAPYWQLGSDFDGDGRSEITVATTDPAGNLIATYFVPGSTAAGVHHPADVGIRVGDGGLPTHQNVAGDLDGDGADDLIGGTTSPIYVHSGATMMAPGPGGRYEPGPGDVREVPGDLIGVVPVTRDLFALVLIEGPDEVKLWVNGASVRFTTLNSGVPFPHPLEAFTSRFASVREGPGDDVWLLVSLERERPGADRWVWDLDSICGEPLLTAAGRSDAATG
jgi:hypothetical protein